MRVLVVEDEADLALQIRTELSRAGFTVDCASDGEEACFLGQNGGFDAIVLDLGLPIMDGVTVLKAWRAESVLTPVLILTARGRWEDRVDGLNAGGDDYLVKPFKMEELIARLHALIRRSAGIAAPALRHGGVVVHTDTGRVYFNDRPIDLTANELKLLSALLLRPDKIYSKFELAERIYGYNEDRDSNTVEVYVGRLRQKLGASFIRTIRGRGYTIGSQGCSDP